MGSQVEKGLMIMIVAVLLIAIGYVQAQERVTIVLPSSPEVQSIIPQWRGHNLSATTLRQWVEHQGFQTYFPQLYAGVLRWPGGNSANSYRWMPALQQPNVLNLRNMVALLRQFEVQLQIVVNFGNGSPQEAAELVRICNSPAEVYRSRRQEMLGTEQPLDVMIWEIGNEISTPWAFRWSWLGYQPEIYGYQGAVLQRLTKRMVDSLYYYGGGFWRQGWVRVQGGLTPLTAILGDLRYYREPKMQDTIVVQFPKLDHQHPDHVRVYRAANVELQWIKEQDNPQVLYDRFAAPENRLDSSSYWWDSLQVVVAPPGGLRQGDVILVEYYSVGHAGAFAFRDSMKAADPRIRVGYVVDISAELEKIPEFPRDFRRSPPDFMVYHPYGSAITRPAVEHGQYAEAIYTAEFKVDQLRAATRQWQIYQQEWQLPNVVKIGVTEWNIALCDECPDPHPFDGIVSALYVADYWSRLTTAALEGSVDLEVENHFSLLASGSNFIHLFHSNLPKFVPSAEGIAMLLVRQALGCFRFPVTVIAMPTLNIHWKDGERTVDALSVFAGIDCDQQKAVLVVINRDPNRLFTANVVLPEQWKVENATVVALTGNGEGTWIEIDSSQIPVGEGGKVRWDLPPLSLNVLLLPVELPTVGVNDPRSHLPRTAGIVYDLYGRAVYQWDAEPLQFERLRFLPAGVYMIVYRGPYTSEKRLWIKQP